MSLGVSFSRLPRPVSRLLYPLLRHTNLMRAVEMRHLAPWVRDVQGWHVLDVGCGHGFYSLALALRNASLVGCDLSPSALEAAHQTAQGIGLDGRAAYLVADGARLPLSRNLFDLIVCNCVLEHIVDDRGALAGMHRTLKPGGLLYLTVDNAEHNLNLSFLERLSPSAKARLLRPEVADASTVAQGLDDYLAETYDVQRRYRRDELAETLRGQGFDLLDRRVYLSRLGGVHYEAFHLFRGLDIGRGFGRLAYMITSLLLYPFVALADRPEDERGYGLVFVTRKANAAATEQDPVSRPLD
jgi:ubiquinone/menaquinone biosynthesis C-methylase UbiE